MEYKALVPNVKWNAPAAKTVNILILCCPEKISYYMNTVKEYVWDSLPDAIIWHPQPYIKDELQLIDEVKQMDAVICFMTAQLLHKKNVVIDRILPYIVKKGYPFLPILDEENLEKVYKEKFGKLHYIDNFNKERHIFNAIQRFIQTLHLTNTDNSLPIYNNLEKEEESIFSQTYFVSYRRIDAKYVEGIQRFIHKEERLCTIQVWYDYYENPGENFEQNLINMINRCTAVLLVVTPHILIPGNYVIDFEIPYAKACKKPIIALLMEKTNMKKLYDIAQIERVYKPREWIEFSRILRDVRMPLPDKELSAKKLVKLARAYMEGWNVECNIDAACQLLYRAVQNFYIPAYKNLIEIKTGAYEKRQEEHRYAREFEGENDNEYKTFKDTKEAIRLFKEYKEICVNLYEKNQREEFLILLFNSMREYGEFCLQERLFDDAYCQFCEMYAYIQDKVSEEVNKFTSYLSVASMLIGDALKNLGKYEEAEKYYRKSVYLDMSLNDDGPIGDSIAYTNLLESLYKLGSFLQDRGDFLKAKIMYQEILETVERNGVFYGREWDAKTVYQGYADARAARITEKAAKNATVSLVEIERDLQQMGKFKPKIKKVSREYITDNNILKSTDKKEIELMTHEVMINTFEKMQWLLNFLSGYELDFDLCQNQYCVDAKNIIGVSSLDIMQTFILVVHSTDFVKSAEILKSVVGKLNE